MQRLLWLVCGSCAVLLACVPSARATVTILDGGQLRTLRSKATAPAALLEEAGIILGPSDELLLRGLLVKPDSTVSLDDFNTLQILRAATIQINDEAIHTTALTVGEAVAGTGVDLFAGDRLDPPADTPVTAGMKIVYSASRALDVTVDGLRIQVRSAAQTVGAALAEAGLPLIGLDVSRPAAGQPLPADGRIQVTRVSEALVLAQREIPFQNTFQDSAQIDLGQQQVLQPGLAGLAVSRVRIRYEDGIEVSRKSEAETIVRPPQDRLTARGTKIAIKTVSVGGATIQYWLVLQMYATTYSPCESGQCSYGTKSGLRAGKGVVAVDPSLYPYLNGQRLYISGYGIGVVGDIGGGYRMENSAGVSRYRWIDLGFDDNSAPDTAGWVTVYFLAPAPANIPDALK